MVKLLSPDARAETSLAICLALTAGYVDAYGLTALGTYVSFMSGNTTHGDLLTVPDSAAPTFVMDSIADLPMRLLSRSPVQ